MICTAEPTPPPKFSLGSQEDFFLWTRAIWSLQNHGRTQIKRADLFNLRISFQCLSLPPSNHQAARSAAKHVHPASRLSRCLRRAFQLGYKWTDCLPCKVPARKRPPEAGSAAAGAAASRGRAAPPRSPGNAGAPKAAALGLRGRDARTEKAACLRRA